MIKIENDTIYMSAGEACYIFGLEDGVPMHIYFGKRVEPEDDLRALNAGAAKVPELSVKKIGADGKKQDLHFLFDGAEVEEQEEKTLHVTLTEKTIGLKAHLFYTPNPRGGFTRKAEIENFGSGAVALCSAAQSVACGNGCDIVVADGYNNSTKGVGYLAVATCEGLNERHGDAYGFLCAAADGAIAADGNASVSCDIDGEIKLEPGHSATCPEMLCVYSDCGLGGITRIFHDILRQRQDGLNERVPTVLFLQRGEMSVSAAVEIGFGVVALDCGGSAAADVQKLAAACKEHGIALGLRVSRENIDKNSVLYSPLCKKSENKYKYDYSDEHTLALLEKLSGIIEQYDVHYVTIDAPEPMAQAKYARGMFMLMDGLTTAFSGLRVDFGIRSDRIGKEFAFCHPLGLVRNIICPLPAEDFKQRFDLATLGTLGYELPQDLSDGIKRAVRAQMLSYQDDALSVMRGDMYRQHDKSGSCRMAVSKDKSRAYAVCEAQKKWRVKFYGLDEHNLYHVREQNKTFSGAALMSCGIPLESKGTYVFHILQVADY
ncbi:MAG: GH36 C-terminal domain-containing protein [Clostridiales bacterium]|nr:GH36 C-terminal domain-containing protein [Clostridiales bacterium]